MLDQPLRRRGRARRRAARQHAPSRDRRRASSWVRSFEPIENPSKSSLNSSASITLLGISHITYTSRPFSASREAVAVHLRQHVSRLAQRPAERDHDLHVGQPHVLPHPPHRRALEREALAVARVVVAGGAAEAEHRILLDGLEGRAAEQPRVLVGLEVREAHDHRARIERRRDLPDARGQRSTKNSAGGRDAAVCARRSAAGRDAIGEPLRVEERERMDTDPGRDDELDAGEADSVARECRDRWKARSGFPTFSMSGTRGVGSVAGSSSVRSKSTRPS